MNKSFFHQKSVNGWLMKGSQKLAIKAQMSMKKSQKYRTKKNPCDDTRNNKK
jgi:hypothetical protein